VLVEYGHLDRVQAPPLIPLLNAAIGFLLVLPAQAALVTAYPALAPWREVAAALRRRADRVRRPLHPLALAFRPSGLVRRRALSD